MKKDVCEKPRPVAVTNVYNIENYFGDGCPNSPKTLRFVVSGVEVKDKPKKEKHMFQLKLRTGQQALLNISTVDKRFLPEPLDGDPVATTVSGDAVARVLPGGKQLEIIPSDIPGTSLIELSGDAQEGEDKDVITETIELVTAHDNAVAFKLEVASITDKAPSTPPAP